MSATKTLFKGIGGAIKDAHKEAKASDTKIGRFFRQTGDMLKTVAEKSPVKISLNIPEAKV